MKNETKDFFTNDSEEINIGAQEIILAPEESTDSEIAMVSEATAYTTSVYSAESEESESGDSSGESGSIGSVATYDIDLVNGYLNMEMKDFAWEGNRMPVTISHSYKGKNAGVAYGEWSTTNGDFSEMKVGLGWRLNLMQSMIHTGYNSKGKDTYTYTDESDNTTVFVERDSETCESGTCCNYCYEDENGMGYTYDANSCVMNRGDEKYYFSSGRLSMIEDNYGNILKVNYNVDERISYVQDGVGRRFYFTYDSAGQLIKITAPNNVAITYGYKNQLLTNITFPNSQTLGIEYDSTSHMPEGAIVSGIGINTVGVNFNVTNGKAMSVIAVENRDGTLVQSGRQTLFNYVGNKQTIVTEIDAADGADCPEIKQYKVYLHDSPEKNYSYYESGNENRIEIWDEDGIIVPYTDPGSNIGNLRCENLLENHNFKDNSDTIDIAAGETDITLNHNMWTSTLTEATDYLTFEHPEGMPGYCSVSLVTRDTAARGKGLRQTVTLPAGKYVYSCYLKLESDNTDPERGVYICVEEEDGTEECRSPKITTKGEFVRVAVYFETVNEANYKFGICLDGNVRAKAIAPQLESGEMLSPYNYLSYAAHDRMLYSSVDETVSETVAVVKVRSTKDAKETFTLSGRVKGTIDLENGGVARLKAKINYYDKTDETFDIPVYSIRGEYTFAMLQFTKSRYAGVKNIEVICESQNNSAYINFEDLQLVRNSIVEGLSEDEFSGYSDSDSSEDNEPEVLSSTTGNTDSSEAITFEEALDSFGNALTGTNFKNGEFGTIYTEYKYTPENTSTTILDKGNNKTEEIDQRGNSTTYEYYPETSKVNSVTDRCGNKTSYEYDSSGRTTKVTAPGGGTVSYGYNSYDDLTTITRGDGQSYTMSYDAYRNLTEIRVSGARLMNYTYKNGSNRLKTMTYANGATQTLSYDRFGNLIAENWNDGTQYRYFYDASNELVKTIDISNKRLYNINRVGDNVTSIEEYSFTSMTLSPFASTYLLRNCLPFESKS